MHKIVNLYSHVPFRRSEPSNRLAISKAPHSFPQLHNVSLSRQHRRRDFVCRRCNAPPFHITTNQKAALSPATAHGCADEIQRAIHPRTVQNPAPPGPLLWKCSDVPLVCTQRGYRGGRLRPAPPHMTWTAPAAHHSHTLGGCGRVPFHRRGLYAGMICQ